MRIGQNLYEMSNCLLSARDFHLCCKLQCLHKIGVLVRLSVDEYSRSAALDTRSDIREQDLSNPHGKVLGLCTERG